MAATDEQATDRFTIICVRCERPVTARRTWVGRDVQCPHCASILRVPEPAEGGRPVRGRQPTLTPKLEFNFGCPRCRTLLESHTGMCGQPGRCPTCGARLIVPEVSAKTGMPQQAALLDADDQDPVPMHAYAASGTQAPRIQRQPDGTFMIECPRCAARCEVDENSCPSCGTPFTIEAAPMARSVRRDSWAVAALVLGIISLPLFFLVVPGVLAVVCGVLGLRGGVSGAASAGIVLGVISLVGGLLLWIA